MIKRKKTSSPKTISGATKKKATKKRPNSKKSNLKTAAKKRSTPARSKKNVPKKKTSGKSINTKPRNRKTSGLKASAGKKTTAKRKSSPKKSSEKKTSSKPAATRKTKPKKVAKKRITHKPLSIKPPIPAYKGAKPYLFTSYSHKNMRVVFKIIKELSKSRYRIWYDEGIEPGNEWPEVVGKAVVKCSQFLVFMSRNATTSRNVRNEINLAFSENKDILVIFLEDTRLSEGMKLQIGTVQFINKYESTEKEFFSKLKKVLKTDIRG
jgi:hypothetical protein